ncbi:MAG: hypothetical protein ACYS8Z_03330 [Planctomycetota bacterium]|jgi:hypothetical protein
MKDLHKNPTLYYILVPVLVGFWPLLVWAMYLPEAKKTLKDEARLAKKGEETAIKILMLDPERVDAIDPNKEPTEFSYSEAIDKVAGKCNIPASKYKLNTGTAITKDKQKSQTATLRINEISVLQLAQFLSLIQYHWGTLQCEDITLTKVKADARPDVWTVDLRLNYFF